MKNWIYFFIIIQTYCILYTKGYSEFDRISSFPNTKMNIDGQKADIILRKIVEMAREQSLPAFQVDSLFFIFHRKTYENSLLVLTKNQEIFLISKYKTYYIDDMYEINLDYKFVYYVSDKIDIDLTGVSLFGIESVFQSLLSL